MEMIGMVLIVVIILAILHEITVDEEDEIDCHDDHYFDP